MSSSRPRPEPPGERCPHAALGGIATARLPRLLLVALTFTLLGLVGYEGQRLAGVGSAFAAKYLCSQVFVGGRKAEEVAGDDLPAFHSLILRMVDWRVDRTGTSADLIGIGRRRAVYRPGLGCTLVIGRAPTPVPAALAAPLPRPDDFPPPAAAPGALDKVVEGAFAETDPSHPRRTRALIVVQHGRTLVERYAPGFSPKSRFPGWSMSKSVINAAIGVLVARGHLALDAPAPVPEWASGKDPRHAITLDQLLHMSSGLDFDEDYDDPLSDVLWMLYGTDDSAAYAAAKPLVHAPGASFGYSSGTSAILSRVVSQNAGEPYPLFFQQALFAPLGMASAVIEPDAVGTPMGSSYVWATARDWARFGLLYLNDGVWRGRRILPADWVRYSRSPATADRRAEYGAQFWLKVPAPDRIEPGRPYLVPGDAYYAAGFGAQYLTVIPSRDLVVVRLGLALDPGAWDQEAFLHDLLAALAQPVHSGPP
jgi:CubicO group peptidase (beta-lactamase class C family)